MSAAGRMLGRRHAGGGWARGVRPLLAALLLVVGAQRASAQTEVVEYYGQDALGSIRIVFDASGAAIARADYEPFGELFTVPNGEIRVVRNFTRGAFSGVRLKLLLATADLPRALPVLEAAAQEAPDLLPDLIEPWRLIATDTPVGEQTEIMLIARSRHGEGARLKLDILALLHTRLREAGIHSG